MPGLAVPSPADDLFLAQGDEVNAHRPLLTGDVVAGVPVPVLGADDRTVVIVAHPCAMRTNGVDLAELILVTPVVEHHESGPHVWKRHLKVSPLDGLAGFHRPVAQLERATLVRSADVGIGDRLACASRLGINLLRQRLVHQLTRVVVETWKFDEEAAGTYEEIDLWEDWVSQAGESGAAAGEAAQHFHAWIRQDDGGQTRQERLASPQTAASVRRAAAAAMRDRYRP